jgi:hypothetical protein
VLAQPRQHGETGEHLEGGGRARRLGQLRAADQLLVDALLLAYAQAVRHLDDADPVDEGLVVLVVLEALPFGFVRMRQNDAVEGIAPIFSVPT